MKFRLHVNRLWLAVFLLLHPAVGLTQESSMTQISSETSSSALIDRTSFTDEEKRIIRQFYLGGRNAQSDWRDPENNDPDSYRWKADSDSNKRSSGKHGKGKKPKQGGKGMSPGLANKGELPPGLQKHIEKNGTLPPGLAKRGLPGELTKFLPARPYSQERAIVDEDVVLIEKTTGRILDILRGGARKK